MNKNFTIIITMLLLALCQYVAAQDGEYTAKGTVRSADGETLPGASVMIKGTNHGTVTDSNGAFELTVKGTKTLLVTYIGFASREVVVSNTSATLNVVLDEDVMSLNEINVVSTGYEQLPKERATGSFSHVDQVLIERSVSPDLYTRLAGVTPGLYIDRQGTTSKKIVIRGINTLYANEKPLIVVDNFIYDGDVANINPNDIESITVLKDAAAASIWGARAGNGVIVINTKHGEKNMPLCISFTTSYTVGNKPDVHYIPQMKTTDYIATERELFDEGYYDLYEDYYDKRAYSPVTGLLFSNRNGDISGKELENKLNQLAENDVRDDINNYLYRKPEHQQYALAIQGGGKASQYAYTVGYDKGMKALVGNENERLTLQAKNTWQLTEGLRVRTGLYLTKQKADNNGIDPGMLRVSTNVALPPYLRLADENGNPAVMPKDYNEVFKKEMVQAGFLNWDYKPLEEINLHELENTATELRLNAGVGYKLFPTLSVDASYQYYQNKGQDSKHYAANSYYARNLVNLYSSINNDGTISRPIPEGGILDLYNANTETHNGRVQVNLDKRWNNVHEVSALGGFEIKQTISKGNGSRYYGYDQDIITSLPVDYTTQYPQSNVSFFSNTIPDGAAHTWLTDRYISYYANASYRYDKRYLLTLSARQDKSNLFGVKTNQKGVPLWSVGAGWQLTNETFFHVKPINYLKLRASYGYSGNIDKTVTAFTTAEILGANRYTGLLYGRIINAPNADLRWETTRTLNMGMDMELFDGRISGSVDAYAKKGEDIIGYEPISATSGQSEYKGNVADIKGSGMEIVLNSVNIDKGIKWETQLNLNKAKTWVTHYKAAPNVQSMLEFGGRGIFPVEGNDIRSIYSLPWAGLDPDTGDPQGYRGGEVSKDYASIITNATVDSLIYHGPANPTTFGGLRNTISWKGLSLSFNITGSFGYYFRRESIIYGNDHGLGGHVDYYDRWQKPGDEATTDVPSIPEAGNDSRDRFYRYSEVLIEKGDHIRLQDVNLTYTMKKSKLHWLPVNQIQVYTYILNPGIIWKASDKVKDPEYLYDTPPRSYSIGLRVKF